MNTTTEHDAKRNVWIAKGYHKGNLVATAEDRKKQRAVYQAEHAASFNGDGEERDE